MTGKIDRKCTYTFLKISDAIKKNDELRNEIKFEIFKINVDFVYNSSVISRKTFPLYFPSGLHRRYGKIPCINNVHVNSSNTWQLDASSGVSGTVTHISVGHVKKITILYSKFLQIHKIIMSIPIIIKYE